MKSWLLYLTIVVAALAFYSCGEKKEEKQAGDVSQQVEYSPTKDADIQRYNLERQKELNKNRTPGDTISLVEYVLDNFPEGTYVVDFDKTVTYNIPKAAVLYHNENGKMYAFAVVARSKPGERLIETKNIVGYDQSYIDLDSTKLGTAFFYLDLFEFSGDQWSTVWEAPVPSHGGFNAVNMQKWSYNGTPYIKLDFHYAQGVGHIDYNYFLVNGLTTFPHLLMTYEGINFKRTLANYNNDKFPDYFEYLYYDTGDKVTVADSVPFIWNVKDSLYVNTRNKKQTRPY